MNKILIQGDSKEKLKQLTEGSVDFMATDPPYGYKFMGLDFDKALPDREIWKESFRVLKEGSFICVMAAPRTDVLWRICRDLEEAGFDMSFTNIEWVYNTGFPKASDTSKQIDKRLGVEREVVGKNPNHRDSEALYELGFQGGRSNGDISKSNTDLGQKYEGSKLGFQPKPAREIIIVGMKPFKEKSYIDKVLNFEELPENIQRTYPLIQTPKPSKKEKQIGVDKNNHPTIKPIKLMSYLITLFTREGDYVLDPFMGSGTTGLACKLLNRNFIGIDYTEEYFNIAEERLNISRGELINTLKIKVQGELF